MAKQTGLAIATLSVDDSGGTARDLRNDITNFDFATPSEVQDITGVDKSAYERQLLLGDFSINLNGILNTAANKSHDVFKDYRTNQRTVLLGVGGATLSNECIATDYSNSRDSSGAYTWSVPLMLADGTVPVWA